MLKKIIKKLQTNEHAHLTWVGENYSKADLIRDLEEIQVRLDKELPPPPPHEYEPE